MSKNRTKKGTARKLRPMCFNVPTQLYERFKIKTIKDRTTVRAVAEALLNAYIQGDLQIEEEKSDPKEKNK